jgi:hypothetical protein
MVVEDADSSEFAQTQLTAYKKQRKALEDERLDITRDLDNAKKKIIALYAPTLNTLDLLVADINKKVVAYDDKVRAEAAEKQRALDEANEKQRQKDLALAEKAEARGDTDKAEQFRDRAETRIAEVVAPVTHVLAGRSMPETFSYETEVIEENLKREYLMPDHSKIGKVVRALGKAAAAAVTIEGKADAIKVTSSRSVRG